MQTCGAHVAKFSAKLEAEVACPSAGANGPTYFGFRIADFGLIENRKLSVGCLPRFGADPLRPKKEHALRGGGRLEA